MSVAWFNVIAEPLTREFEDIFREHYDLVHGTAYGVTGRREDAEDVVQTVFLRVLRRGMPADCRQNSRAYLYRAAVNQSLNVIRARRRRPVIPAADLDNLEMAAATGSASAEAEDVHGRLYEAIGGLNPKHAEILILRYIHEYSDVEIANLLGTSRGTIASAFTGRDGI